MTGALAFSIAISHTALPNRPGLHLALWDHSKAATAGRIPIDLFEAATWEYRNINGTQSAK